MHRHLAFTLVLALTLLGGTVVRAGPITDLGLFSTGSSGWEVGGINATTATTIPGSWASNTGTSSWISTQADASVITDSLAPTGPYYYTFQFAVPSKYVLESIVISGRWALDDYGTAYIGGSVVSTLPEGGDHSSQPAFANQTFSITTASGLVLGANTLTFEVVNDWQGIGSINPTGLRVEFTSITGDLAPTEPIPDPGSSLLLFGISLAGLRARRKRWQ